MSVVVVTGSAGLVGSESARHFASLGFDVVGIDNDMRAYFFGPSASTAGNLRRLKTELPTYSHESIDIRNDVAVNGLYQRLGASVALTVHAAAQPSHDWAARDPIVDFDVNARATLILLEAARRHCPEAAFIYMSTNKVYGDRPNQLPLEEHRTRWEMPPAHPWAAGLDETMSVDACLHSIFGASKLAADVMVQEYGRYFGMPTASFRGGCLTGPAHAGAELHGFLAYLMHCTVHGHKYRVFGYGGKQVRDNIHSWDLVRAFDEFRKAPRPGEVYNIGGSRFSNCSVLEAIELCQEISGRRLDWEYSDTNRVGDHIWWISDVGKFQRHYPGWSLTRGLAETLTEMYEAQADVRRPVEAGSSD